MAEDDGEGDKYKFITENGEENTTSRGYTGKALACYTTKDTYQGGFIDGIREGMGTYMYHKGENKAYEGDWLNNMKHGIGKMRYQNAGEYNGMWENGRRHGEGIFIYNNGDQYSGWWKFG